MQKEAFRLWARLAGFISRLYARRHRTQSPKGEAAGGKDQGTKEAEETEALPNCSAG